ncbi:MAG: methyltransferase [Rikenellaceae bacterium]
MSFNFKYFSINQELAAMKVGTDGVLLGAWATLRGNERNILDIGTGTGLIAIMMAQRSAAQVIVGVEIDENSAKQAAQNMSASKWAERLSVAHTPIQQFSHPDKFDLILSNPPYFVNSLLAKGTSRTNARHTTELSFEDLASSAHRLLAPNGRFALILPPTETELFDKASNDKLHLSRRCYVRGKSGGVVRRVMSEYRLSKPTEISEQEIAVRATPPEEYTAEYRALTSEFYLKF